MSGALLLGTEKPILYSLALLLPSCNSPVSQEAQALLQGFPFMLNLYPNITCFPIKGWFPLQEARGCCLETACSHQGRCSGTHPWGRHRALRGGEYFQPFQFVFTMVSPVRIYYALLHFMASLVFSHSFCISWLLPVMFTGLQCHCREMLLSSARSACPSCVVV